MGPRMKQALIILGLVFLLVGFAIASEEVSDEFTGQEILAEFTILKRGPIFLPVRIEKKDFCLFSIQGLLIQ